MGYIIIHNANGSPRERLGDDYGKQKALKSMGMPHTTPESRRVTRTELDAIETYDSGDVPALERNTSVNTRRF